MRHQVVPAVYVYLTRGRNVLLQLRQNTQFMNDRWAAGAAGHVEAGELPLDTAIREAREELGITLTDADLQPRFTALCAHANGDPLSQRVDFIFTASTWAGDPRIAEPSKCADLQWFSLDALPSATSEYEAPMLAHLAADAPLPIIGLHYDL